jgi:hypothetical protein
MGGVMTVTRFPTEGPYAAPEGARVFEVIVPEDVATGYGNVSVPAGRYEAIECDRDDSAEGTVMVFSPEHYSGHRIYVSLLAHLWTFPGEATRPIPEHDCIDYLVTGVVAEDEALYCGICREEF